MTDQVPSEGAEEQQVAEPADQAAQPSPAAAPQPPAAARRRGVVGLGGMLVVFVSLAAIAGFMALFLRQKSDPGIRVWLLNHTPDQIAIINPFDGVVEKKFAVADGLRELKFSSDYRRAYVANVVDISNRLTVLDTRTYLEEDVIEVDGVPQGIGVFPDGDKLAVITGSRTDFMAGGFDVIDLTRRSEADPKKKLKLYRERGMQLGHMIAVSDDGDRVYMIDAKSSELFVFSLSRKERIGSVNLMGAPEELLYPEYGEYYYVSVLAHQAIYQIRKSDDQINAAFIYAIRNPDQIFNFNRLRYCAVSYDGRYLFGTNYEGKSVAMWQIGNPDYMRSWQEIPDREAEEHIYVHQVPYYLPQKRFKLKGGYNPSLAYTPGPKQIATDFDDQFLFVVDDEGALYVYRMDDVMKMDYDPARIVPPVLEQMTLVTDILGDIRDLKISRPAIGVGGGGST